MKQMTAEQIAEARFYAQDMGFEFCEVCFAVTIPSGDPEADTHKHDD